MADSTNRTAKMQEPPLSLMPPGPRPARTRRHSLHALPLALAAVCILIELAIDLGPLAWGGTADWRRVAIEYGGFWPGLLGNWQPNYPGQPALMFVTYSFLHAGLIHLAVNMVTLLSLADAVVDRIGQARFLLLYLGSAAGGGLAYALILPTVSPVVGASGALFGLFGALLAWDYGERPSDGASWHVARTIGLLAGLNLVLWWAMDGMLAWQAHLGGFIAGWVLGRALDDRRRRSSGAA